MADPALTLNQIKKSYRTGFKRTRSLAVDELSINVPAGQIFGLLGPNGAGKTTTIKILLGVVFPDSGGGTIMGRPLGDRASHRKLGFLPEQPYFYTFLTAEKGLKLYGKFFGLDGRELTDRSAELLDMVGLARGSHLPLDKYSKGMLQRFGIAQALVNDPELVILDEPSSGLDPVGQKEVRDLLVHLKDQGKTIMLSSHQLSEVENICDSVSIINRGRCVREGRLSELLDVKGLRRITVSGTDPESADRLSEIAENRKQEDGRTVFEVREEMTFRALEVVRFSGLGLVSVEPQRRRLEDLFMEAVKETSN